jgi:PBP1b-binding outer membrane lipoprotein LpoB
MKQILVIALLSTLLTGCASFDLFGSKVKPIEVVSKKIKKTALDIDNPEPLQSRPIEWIVVTPDNAEAVFKRMDEKGQSLVLFALTDDGYQQLSLSIGDIRNLINTQRTIIIKYKEYYEPKKPKVKK